MDHLPRQWHVLVLLVMRKIEEEKKRLIRAARTRRKGHKLRMNIFSNRIHSYDLTNRFHVTVRLFSNRPQMTSKCGKIKVVAHEPKESVSPKKKGEGFKRQTEINPHIHELNNNCSHFHTLIGDSSRSFVNLLYALK